MTFDRFIESAWNDHGDRPDEVAARLSSGMLPAAEGGRAVGARRRLR